jgi:hypothetical protein
VLGRIGAESKDRIRSNDFGYWSSELGKGEEGWLCLQQIPGV